MLENIAKIRKTTNEISGFSTFFKSGRLKQDICESLDIVEIKASELDKNYKQTCSEFDMHKSRSIDDIANLNSELSKSSIILNDLNIKHTLTSKLISAKSNNDGLREYKEILYGDFMKFANIEDSLANEADAILKLQSIEKELEVITSYPELYKKNTIAVGGGFSAGKSEFISGFFKDGTKLPIGIEPTTAIPAYVIRSDKKHIIGCSHNGGAVDLEKIDSDFQSKLSHNFIKSFDFNLKEIMPFMVLGADLHYEHICFIDTPGYNPSDASDSYAGEDIKTAKEFLSNASTFIWLIGADANGTIPASDLDFLSELDLENKKFYVVLNKADLRGASDIEDILDEIEESLDDYDIESVGISAYSSVEQKEYSYRKESIEHFVESCDSEAKIHQDMLEKLYSVYLMYKHAIMKDIKGNNAIQGQLKSISLDMLEEGFDNATSPIHQRLDNLKNIFDIKVHQDNLKSLEVVIKSLKDAVDNVFEKESKINFQDIVDDNIELDFDFSIDEIDIDDELDKFEKAEPKKRREKGDEVIDEDDIVVLSAIFPHLGKGFK